MKLFLRFTLSSLLALGLLASTSVTRAQSFAIDWFSIDGGGGTSSGGSYTLIGTIGQPDAGTLSGGSYVLEGGFLSGIYVIQTLGAPLLSIQKTGTNAVISWPLDASAGFLLEETSNLTLPTSWIPTTATLTTNGPSKTATVPANQSIRFFRLRNP